MRIAMLVAMSLLVAGCSHTVAGSSGQSSTGALSTVTSSTRAPSPSTSTSAAAPPAGAPISDVIAWIEAAHQVDAAHYHSATRDGVTTQLGTDVAFSTAAGAVNCMTDTKHTGEALACLIKLNNPPPRPDTAYGEWKAGWVDFDGTNLQVGSARADPGQFLYGNGPELTNGDSLSVGDYRCRADQVGLICVNYAHQSAARFANAGIEPFGCLQSVPPPDGVGIAFRC